MKRTPIVVLLACASTACTTTDALRESSRGAAAPRAGPARPWEFTVAGTGASNEELDAGTAQGSVAVGYYFGEVFEVSARQNGTFLDPGPGISDAWTGATRLALDVHFPLGTLVPYAGVNFGYVYGDSIRDSFMGGPEAGVKLYLKNDAFLLVAAEYQFFFDEGDSLQTAFDEGQVLYGIGIGLRF